MACKYGRPGLTTDQDRRLFAESAGTCLLCNAPLFRDTGAGARSVSIADQAHIIAHSPQGPRADPGLPEDERGGPNNLVLLCPTCHREADRNPDDYPASALRLQKGARTRAVSIIGGSPQFTTRNEAHAAVTALLDRNRAIFCSCGPDPSDGSVRSSEEARAWTERVLNSIVPNNRLVVAIVDLNTHLTDDVDREIAELLRQHTADLESKHVQRTIVGSAARFPDNAYDLFAKRVDDD